MKKILVIEDERAVLEDILELLGFEGFETLGAGNGLLGLQLAREQMPDLVICDIMMPELDGYEVLQELRSDLVTATIPFMFLTAKAERQDMRKGMELGADDYITKPYMASELLAAVHAQFQKHSAAENERLRQLSQRLVAIQETERQRIAHELRSEVGQLLSGLRVILGTSRRFADEPTRPKLDEAQALVNELIHRVEKMAVDLRPTILDDLGLLPTLLRQFQHFTDQTQIQVILRHSGLERRFPSEIETAAYRIVQEALDNVACHTRVLEVSVQIWTDRDVLSILVEDQGEGFDLEAATRTHSTGGLLGIYERATALNGQLTVMSAPGRGTRVMARLPVGNEVQRLPESPEMRAGLSSMLTAGPVRKPEVPPESAAPAAATTIVLADSYALIRQGLRGVLEAEPGLTVIGEARAVQEALHLIKQYQPDVLVVNWDMGLEIASQIAQLSPRTHVLIISDRGDEAYILDALRRGATGYVPKEASADELIEAVHHVAEGQRYLSREFSERAIDFYVKLQRTEDPNLDVSGGLTSREQEILELIANGCTNAEVAEQLTISPRTVETHRANLMRKLGLRNQAELIRYALQRGIISLKNN